MYKTQFVLEPNRSWISKSIFLLLWIHQLGHSEWPLRTMSKSVCCHPVSNVLSLTTIGTQWVATSHNVCFWVLNQGMRPFLLHSTDGADSLSLTPNRQMHLFFSWWTQMHLYRRLILIHPLLLTAFPRFSLKIVI